MKRAFTLIELLTVVLILGLLATIAVGVFTNQVERARVAAARSMIATLELGINRYQIDVGSFPPSGSGVTTGLPNPVGSGLLHMALTRGLSDASTSPAAMARWQGPYIDIKESDLGDINGAPIYDPVVQAALQPGEIQILDPWESPYRYVRCCGTDGDEYATNDATRLPLSNPFAATDVYFNPSTFQIVSRGPDGLTHDPTSGMHGLDDDDVTNFGL